MIPADLRRLIRRMASENPTWGQERIANELWLKLAIRVSPRTARKYMPKPVSGRPRSDQRWSTFLRNHAQAIVACDFFVAITTATFRLIYVLVVDAPQFPKTAALQCHEPPHGRLDLATVTTDVRTR